MLAGVLLLDCLLGLRCMFVWTYPKSVFILKMLLPIFALADFSPYGLPLLALLFDLATFGIL